MHASIKRPALVSVDQPIRHTLVVEPAMAGMMALLPDERLLDSRERADGMIELTVGPKPQRRSQAWTWLALAAGGATLGGLLAQGVMMLLAW